jgi:hypothetical protein
MAIDKNKNEKRQAYAASIRRGEPTTGVLAVMEASINAAGPIGNDEVRDHVVNVRKLSKAGKDKKHTDKSNACEQEKLLKRVQERPTPLRITTEKGRQFFEIHRHLLR